MNEHLSQEEIDTLLKGVDSGEIDTQSRGLAAAGEAVPYELGSQDLTHGHHLPAIDRINERFVRSFEKNISAMLRRSVEVTTEGAKIQRFDDFTGALKTPANLNLINISPLHGTGLMVFESELVLSAVDNYFGGDGRYPLTIEGREFTPTENHVIQLLLDMSFADLAGAWRSLVPLEFVYIRSEIEPQFASIVGPDEVVVVSSFTIEHEGGNGAFHLVIPNALLESVKELDGIGVLTEQSGVDQDWVRSIKDGIKQAVVEIDCIMAHTKLALSDVLKLNPGDVIPIDLPELVMVRAAETPIFRGTIGVSNGKNAVQYIAPVERPDYSHD